MELESNHFGGLWTQQKITIFIKYLYAYLEIMKKQKFKLIYFDGFAGCGTIENESQSLIESVAMQVLNIQHEKVFDIYYLVDKDEDKTTQLKSLIGSRFPNLTNRVHVVASDCNHRLVSMAKFMNNPKNRNYKALAFIDPFGMSMKWESLEACKGLGIDMWILIPTGIGVNRLLVRDGNIPEPWRRKLESFLGITDDEIMKTFYTQNTNFNLFGEEETKITKEERAIQKVVELSQKKLKTVWKHVSQPYPMKNSTGAVLYHFLLATNNEIGFKIANEIIGKKLNTP